MSDKPKTSEQQVGEIAAQALDFIDGRPLIGAVLMVAVDCNGTASESQWFAPAGPGGQPWLVTLGLVEDWRQIQQARMTASRITAMLDDDGDA